MIASTHEPSSSSEPSELEAALQRCGALEGELSQLKREHERTTAKLSHLLKKRGGSDDGGETETGAELAQLRQQVVILQWREQQYKQALLARSSPSDDQRPQHPAAQGPTAHLPSRAGIPDTKFQSRAGIPDTHPRFAAAVRQASMPSRQITPPSPAPPSCGVKRTAPTDDCHVVRRCASRVTCPRATLLLTPQPPSLPLAGQAQAFDADGTHDRDRAPCAAAALLWQPAVRRPRVWVHGRSHQYPAARDQGSSRVRSCLEARATAAPMGADVPARARQSFCSRCWECSACTSGRLRVLRVCEHGRTCVSSRPDVRGVL